MVVISRGLYKEVMLVAVAINANYGVYHLALTLLKLKLLIVGLFHGKVVPAIWKK